ncbi:hypothetical protein FK531_03975 [Rhodococcus spelaei]|uniref:Facilitated glucose transporter n=1 Tax=Rhodococcus spelaei TaxID=2546320 RepID=A0A541BND3_9NOCA|nr:hypothetical protein [Rhodococcus spelaei]TQF73847.1 hypothetical protein FK531_03975 [Rhodococcus spelaei]
MTASQRTPSTPGILDSAILALLVFDGLLTAVLAVLFLPVRLGSVPFPVSALAAAVINVLLVVGARTVTDRPVMTALPVVGWFVGFAICMFGGPGGDALLLADWRTLLLLVCGVVPPGILLFKFASDAAVARGQAARPR